MSAFRGMAVLLLVLVAVPVFGQSQAINGTIEGTIVDASGGLLPGVTVTVTNTDDGTMRTVVTNERGEKLSKQTGARALSDDVRGELERAARHLGLPRIGADTREAFLIRATELWRERWVAGPTIAAQETTRG